MAYFYVKSGLGTRTTGGGTTKQTGTFTALGAANVYASVTTAIADSSPPVAGDFILCSSVHAANPGVAIVWALPDGVTVMSVDDTAVDQYLAGAKETANTGGTILDFDIQNAAVSQYNSVIGMTIEAENEIGVEGTGCVWQVRDCTFNWLNAHTSQKLVTASSSDANITFYNTEFNFGHIGSATQGSINITVSADLTFIGCTSTGTPVTTLLEFGTSGGSATFKDCNLAQLIATSGNLIDDFLDADRDMRVTVDACKLPTSMNVFRVTPVSPNHFVDIYASGSADEYYSYFQQKSFHTAEEDLVQYLAATYDGTNEFSTKITTHSTCSLGFPYRYKLALLPARDLSGASGETFTVELVSSDSGLTDADVWIELEYQDNTDQALGVLQSTRNADYFAAGTGLTSSSAVWAVTTNTEYKITEQITQKTAVTNTNVAVYVNIAKAITVNIDPSNHGKLMASHRLIDGAITDVDFVGYRLVGGVIVDGTNAGSPAKTVSGGVTAQSATVAGTVTRVPLPGPESSTYRLVNGGLANLIYDGHRLINGVIVDGIVDPVGPKQISGGAQSQNATVFGNIDAGGDKIVSGGVQSQAPILNGSIENKFLSGAVAAQDASVSGTVGIYPSTGWSLVNFTVNYAGLNANSPFAGDVTYAALVSGDKCHFETLTDPDGHTITMAGDGEFSISPTALTQNQTFDFQIYDTSDGSFGATATITVQPGDPDFTVSGGVTAQTASVNGTVATAVTLSGGVAAGNATVFGTVNKGGQAFLLGGVTAQNAAVSGTLDLGRLISGGVQPQNATVSGNLNKIVKIGVLGNKIQAQSPILNGPFIAVGVVLQPSNVVKPARRLTGNRGINRKTKFTSLNRK